jgi:hypothetical protein
MLISVGNILKGMGLGSVEFRELCTHYPDSYWDGEIDQSKWKLLLLSNPAMWHFFEALATTEHSGITLNMLLKLGKSGYSLEYALEVFKVYRSILVKGEKVIKKLGSNQNLSLTPFKTPLSHDSSY